MANKRLGTAATELKLPAKKGKGEKKPKWQAKTGNKKGKDVEAVETQKVVVEEPVEQPAPIEELTTLPPEPTYSPDVATTPEGTCVGPATANEGATMHNPVPNAPDGLTAKEPAEETSKEPRKLKVKADAPPKKLSMVAAALQVLQDRKVAMTCPEMIDVMATEGLWVSPGGKTPANTLYMVVT